MSIGMLVQIAEGLTAALVVGLFVRIFLLDRAASMPRTPQGKPATSRVQSPQPLCKEAALESYIDEILGDGSDGGPLFNTTEGNAPKDGASSDDEPPAGATNQPYQSVAALLANRYDTGPT